MGRTFFDRLFASAGVRANWYPYTGGPTFPHSKGIREAIATASSLFVVLSKPMVDLPHVRSWVSFEAGLAVGLGRPVWVFEPIDEQIEIPVPGAFAYLQRPLQTSTLRTFPYETIIGSAGTRFPDPGESDVWFYAICRGLDCGERFVAHVLDSSTARCPACRKTGTLSKQTSDELRVWSAEPKSIRGIRGRPMPVSTSATGLPSLSLPPGRRTRSVSTASERK